jgi:hypothetical protein
LSSIDLSVSGDKATAKRAVRMQIPNRAGAEAICTLIDCAGGNQVSITGTFSQAEDGKSGTFTLSGSSWTR